MDSLEGVRGDFCVTGITETRRDIRAVRLSHRRDFQVTLRSTEVNRQVRQALAAAPFQFSAQAER